MLELPNVTVVCIDCLGKARAVKALVESTNGINFFAAKWITSLAMLTPHPIILSPIPHIGTKEDYSKFVVKELYKYFETDYVLIVQWDGYVLNPKAWTDEFLQYDYIGAPWHFRTDIKVGNGGFSLRSKKLMTLLATSPEITRLHPEDDTTTIIYRQFLIDKGIKFAPVELAYKFSVEHEPYVGSFGYHGGNDPRK